MRKISRFVLVPAALLAVAGGLALAADQTILGRTFTVKNPGDPSKRKVTGVAKEKNSANSIVGNPTVTGSAGGAILRFIANGANSTDQSFPLPQGNGSNGKPFWTASATGYKYKDPRGEQGPIKTVLVKASNSGTFVLKAVAIGKNGTINVVPPNPGTSGFMTLTIGVNGTGERYCVQYGPESQTTNKGTTLFKQKNPGNQGCPPPPVTTTTSSTTLPSITTTTTSSTTTTTLYGSPSRAFLVRPADLLD